MAWLEAYNATVLGVGVPLCLAVAGVWFAIRLKFFPLRHPVRVWRSVMRPGNRGDISPVRALSMALAGTLGVGNLVGVSSAIALGGAGAIFWMWVSATLAMLLKYAETVLAVRHRRVVGGARRGGATYYMLDAFRGKRAWVGRTLAAVFALLCFVDALSMGCMVQINAMASACSAIPRPLLGVAVALTVFAAGLGGAKRVSRWTERLIPVMTVGFALLSVLAIAGKAREIPSLLWHICTSAFSPDGAVKGVLGGVGGFLLSRALRFGTMRGLLSNEAGCGTSPMAHAAADTNDASAQGCLGMVEVFVDTHVLCTLTALVVLLGLDEIGAVGDPMLMTLRAYERLLGGWAGLFLRVAVFCFGLATLLCWSHYAVESCAYLAGDRGARARGVRAASLWVYCAFCVVGAVYAPQGVWSVADLAIGSMTLLNVAVLCRMHREVEDCSQGLIK